jgi:hypothetical protein
MSAPPPPRRGPRVDAPREGIFSRLNDPMGYKEIGLKGLNYAEENLELLEKICILLQQILERLPPPPIPPGAQG